MTNKEKELTRLYGDFLTRFEFVCSRLRYCINYLLFPDYDISKRNLCEIMTEGLTADPLRKKFMALLIERYTNRSDIYKAIIPFNKSFQDLIELRNSFAHGTPFFGEYDFISETKKARLALRHPKLKSEGLDLNFKLFDSTKLKQLIAALIIIESSLGTIAFLLKHEEIKEDAKKKHYERISNQYKLINIKDILKKKSK